MQEKGFNAEKLQNSWIWRRSSGRGWMKEGIEEAHEAEERVLSHPALQNPTLINWQELKEEP